MGRGRLRESDERREVADAALTVAQRVEKVDPRRITENLEYVSYRLNDGPGEQVATNGVENRGGGVRSGARLLQRTWTIRTEPLIDGLGHMNI